jgi:Ca2+-binding RTX toxin-like protein
VFGRDQTAGGFPAEFELSSLLPANGGDGSAGFVLNGIDAGDGSGRSVSAAGDVNGDGIDDLLIGAYDAQPGGRYGAGESYVVFGRDQTAGGFPAELELSSLLAGNGGDGSAGFVLYGSDTYDYSGRVSAAGDVNGDGIDDVLLGAPGADPGGQSYAGESYVVFGRMEGAGVQCEGLDATIVGTQGNDDIRGTRGPDVINALGGDDTIRGRGGDDIICGGAGDDVIYGKGDHDSLFGQAGDDTLLAAGGSDFLVGGQGNDALNGGGGGDQLFGDEGDDTLRGGGRNDNSDGGPGIDFCGGGGGQRDTGANCESSKNIP